MKTCPFCGVAPHAKHGFVYVLIFHANITKIGKSENPSTRVCQHVNKCALPIRDGFLFSVLDEEQAEAALLNHFSFAAINGSEWFWIPKKHRQFLARSRFTLDGCTFSRNTCPKHCPACAHLSQRDKIAKWVSNRAKHAAVTCAATDGLPQTL